MSPIGSSFVQKIEFEYKVKNFIGEPNDGRKEVNLNITENTKLFLELLLINYKKTNQTPFRGRASFALMMKSGKNMENMAPLNR